MTNSAMEQLYNSSMNQKPMLTSPMSTMSALSERAYIRILTEWSMSRFKWTVPKSIDARFIERELFFRGMVVFYWEDKYDRFMAVRGTAANGVNAYDNPTALMTTSVANYRSVTKSAAPTYSDIAGANDYAVPIWANSTRIPDLDIVMLYAMKLAQIDVSLQIAVKNMRLSRLVVADESKKLSLQNVMRRLDKGDSVVYAMPGLDVKEAIQAIDIGANPQVLSALRLEKNQVWNEAMTLLGINNSNQDKKERLVASEVNANTDQVERARASAMQARETACNLINELWPQAKVSVEWNEIKGEVRENASDIYDGATQSSGDIS